MDKTKECDWIFTFGHGTRNAGTCVRIHGTYGSAREKMFELFGNNWGFQYSAEEWENWLNTPDLGWMLEKEVSIEDAAKQREKV